MHPLTWKEIQEISASWECTQSLKIPSIEYWFLEFKTRQVSTFTTFLSKYTNDLFVLITHYLCIVG